MTGIYIASFYILFLALIGESIFFLKKRGLPVQPIVRAAIGGFTVFAVCVAISLPYLYLTKRFPFAPKTQEVASELPPLSPAPTELAAVPPTAAPATPAESGQPAAEASPGVPTPTVSSTNVTPTTARIGSANPTATAIPTRTPTATRTPTPTKSAGQLPETGGGQGEPGPIVQPQLPIAGFFHPTVLAAIAGVGLLTAGFLF